MSRRTRATGALLGCVALLAVGCATDGGGAEDAVLTATPQPTSDATGPGTSPPDGTAEDAEDDPAAAVGQRREVAVSTLDGDGCSGTTDEADFPDVVGARFTPVPDRPGAWRVAVTLCSGYDTPDRYADAWRVRAPGGEVLGLRVLLHDHAGEQPFTRSLGEPLTVPDGVATVLVEGRDLVNGWGGATLDVQLDG